MSTSGNPALLERVLLTSVLYALATLCAISFLNKNKSIENGQKIRCDSSKRKAVKRTIEVKIEIVPKFEGGK